jgi:GGDEF domain-containing protein
MILSIQKFAKFAKHLDLSIIYDKNLSLEFIEAAKLIFRKVHLRGIDESDTEGVHVHLLLLCITSLSLKSPLLKSSIASVQRLVTVILTPDHLDINIFRSALSLQALHVGTFPLTEEMYVQEMVKVLPNLIKKHNESITDGFHRNIAEYSQQMFAIVKNGKPIYANESAKKHFGIQLVSELEAHLNSREISELLKKTGSNQHTTRNLTNLDNGSSEYFITTHPLRESQTLLGIVPLKLSLQNCEKKLLNRMSFIEILKDAFLIHSSENESIPVVMIHIENSQKIIESSSENIYNEISKELLILAKNYFSRESEIAQWHRDVYTVMSPGTTIEELKVILEQLHQDVTTNSIFEGAALVLDSFVIDMNGVDLNKAIEIIDHIHQKQLLSNDISNLMYHEVSGKHHNMDEKDQVLHYLEKLMLNKSPIKLMNFYKGIRITTPARLVKLADGVVYIAIEKIQGYAMKLENMTVIQSSSIPFDLQTNIKIVDIGKKIAVLTNFQPLKASANSRQHIRIQSDHRMHVTMTSFKSVMSGTIMDISIKSIACKINGTKVIPTIDSSIMLQFQLPNENSDDGMVNMAVEGKIQYIQSSDEFTKIVVILDLQEPYESHLIEYIYKRQQSLINELKMIANKL